MEDIKVSRADKCSRPIVLDKINVANGEKSLMVIPCGSANALKCKSCADHEARTRTRQAMCGLEQDDTQSLFLTLTAPSFGKVHRASWSVKDEWRATRNGLEGDALRLHKMEVMRKKKPCACGKFHEHTYDRIGVPVDEYDYAGEIIWNETLPFLMKSAVRRLKYIATGLGIAKDDLSMFGVYERQKRGSLHVHMLICVKGNVAGFRLLADELKDNWVSPTAKIPENRVEWYLSKKCAQNWRKARVNKQKVADAIPMARWKGGVKVPATQFGEIYDIQVLGSQQKEDADGITGYKQASHYISKYLTKNQAAFGHEALEAIESPFVAEHFENFRKATMAICADRIVSEVLSNTAYKQLSKFVRDLPKNSDGLTEEEADLLGERYIALVKQCEAYEAKGGKIEAHEFLRELYAHTETWRIDGRALGEATSASDLRLATRSLVVRLNKVLDNAGFTGSLTIVSNWIITMKALNDEMRAYHDNGIELIDPNEYAYELNLEEMKNLKRKRIADSRVIREIGAEALFTTGLVKRVEPKFASFLKSATSPVEKTLINTQ